MMCVMSWNAEGCLSGADPNVTIVETLVESWYDVCYVMECRRVFIRRLS